MEGMPRFAPIIPDIKKPVNDYDDEFVYSLKEYILMHFQADPSDFDSAINELRSIKQEVIKCHVDVEAVCILKRYFAQLLMMKNRFPMEQGGAVKANFTWYERALEMPTAQSFADINFEMACVMYQIGAIHASIAGLENRQNDDSIKNAFMHFQYAAWPFQYIRDNMEVSAYGTSDFDKELLTFHVNVLLGQAQECLLEKSMLDSKRSPLTVVKLATYLRDLYSQCHTLLRNSNAAVEMLSSKRFKLWTRTVAVKSEIYGSIAMLYMGYKEENEQNFGNRLAWCQAADHYLTRALKVAGDEANGEFADTLTFVRDIVKGRLDNAKKENDFIYHQRVPKFEDLIVTIEGEGKVRPRAFDPLDPSIGGDDIFGALVPPTVLSAVSEYEEEKAKLKREVLGRVNEKNDELQSYLTSLNASELGLSAGPSFTMPEVLLERNAAMHTQSDAVPQVLEKLQLVDKLARDADSQLNALGDRLNSIDLPAFTEDDGYKAISAELSRLSEHQAKARTLNGELHKALAAHSTNIHLLSLPLRELTEKIAPQSDVSPAQTKEGEALIRILDKANEMQSQRATLVDTFTRELDADNISKKLLAERDTDNKQTFTTELKKHEKTIQYIDANLNAQEKILSHLTDTNADFAEQRKVIQELNKERFEQVMTLVTAYDIYTDVSNKAQDGKKFYENLMQRVGKIGQAVEAIEAAYNKERAKLDAERRAVEEKKAAIKAARDAQDALSDFNGFPQQPYNSHAPPPAAPTSRPRLGDYMQFYRNKMATKGGVPPPQNYVPPVPPPLHVPQENMGYRQPPSPAPSSVAGDFPNDGVYQEPYLAPFARQSYISPAPANYSSQQRAPSHPQMLQPRQQYAPPVEQVGYPYGAFPPAPAYPNGLSSVHSSSSELNRLTNNNTPTVPPTPANTQAPTPQNGMPSYERGGLGPQGAPPVMYQPQQHQQFVQPHLPQQQAPYFSTAHNLPSQVVLPQPQTSQQPGNYSQHVSPQSLPPQLLPPPSQQQAVSPQRPPQQFQQQTVFQPVAPQQQPQYAMYNGQQQQYAQPQRPQPQFTQHTHQPVIPQVSNTSLPVSNQQHNQPAISQISNTSLPVLSQQYNPVQQLPPVQQAVEPSPPAAPQLGQPAQNGFWSQQTAQVQPTVATQPQQPAQAPAWATAPSPSPWHNAQRASPWHNPTQQQNFAPASTAPPGQPVPIQRETPVLGAGTPTTNSGFTAPEPSSSNVDLLSSLLGDLNLPPAMAPNQAPPVQMEYHGLQRTAPSNSFHSSSNEHAPIIRPAAAVIPIQQKSQISQQAPTPMLSLAQPSTISVAPQVVSTSNLRNITSPEKFNLGESDKLRLEKRQLHAAIKTNAPLPSLDPMDPLNQLDIFWGAKKN